MLNPVDDVNALVAGSIDDAGKARLREAFVNGKLEAELAGQCETVDGWVWSENPRYLASLAEDGFARGYELMLDWFEQLRGGYGSTTPTAKVQVWVKEARARHEDGSLTLKEHAILQSTAEWTWRGPLQLNLERSQTDLLEDVLRDSAFDQELSIPEHVGFEVVGRLFRALKVGWRRASLELYLEEFCRWTATYPDYPVPLHATSRGLPLGKWVAKMRRHASLDLLDAETFSLLTDTPGWTWGIFEGVVEAGGKSVDFG